MAAIIKVEKEQAQLSLGKLRSAVSDRDALLRICGEIMRTSIAFTFREEGSPAGSWPQLALSTLKKKAYSVGHKLLILSGRLFGSFTYTNSGSTLTIGTSVVYAAAHQLGSRDFMGGAAGPRTKAQMSPIGAYDGLRVQKFQRYGKDQRRGKDGKVRSMRVREQGPANATKYRVGEHNRRQNIPARPFLVFRPEDPTRMTLGIEEYFRSNVPGTAKGGAA